MSNNMELTKMIIAEKDKVILKYKQKLNDIKQHYGVEFDVTHFKDDKVKNITFVNLKYKKSFNNVSISYDNTLGKMNYINYEFSDTRIAKGINHKKLIPTIDKEYKLKMIVAEIDRANKEYIEELNKIDELYKNAPNLSNTKEYSKKDENE
ncbi:MAG: hypothetical protein Q4G05_06185 [Clostridia bacterium]|nr:hypothetical protein [Clostridia bacterium]